MNGKPKLKLPPSCPHCRGRGLIGKVICQHCGGYGVLATKIVQGERG